MPLLDGLDLDGVRLVRSDDESYAAAVTAAPTTPPDAAPAPDSLFMLIFTSGHQRRPEGRADHPREDHLPGRLPRRAARARPRRRPLRLDAAVPLQLGDGRLGAGAHVRRDDRARREVLGQPAARGRTPLRRDVPQLRGQAALLRAGHAGAPRRRRQPAPARVRQRGRRPRHRRLRPSVRLSRRRRLRVDGERRGHLPHPGDPARFAGPADGGHRRPRPRDAARSARARSSTRTAG